MPEQNGKKKNLVVSPHVQAPACTCARNRSTDATTDADTTREKSWRHIRMFFAFAVFCTPTQRVRYFYVELGGLPRIFACDAAIKRQLSRGYISGSRLQEEKENSSRTNHFRVTKQRVRDMRQLFSRERPCLQPANLLFAFVSVSRLKPQYLQEINKTSLLCSFELSPSLISI